LNQNWFVSLEDAHSKIRHGGETTTVSAPTTPWAIRPPGHLARAGSLPNSYPWSRWANNPNPYSGTESGGRSGRSRTQTKHVCKLILKPRWLIMMNR
jgi:hypothetical protein